MSYNGIKLHTLSKYIHVFLLNDIFGSTNIWSFPNSSSDIVPDANKMSLFFT